MTKRTTVMLSPLHQVLVEQHQAAVKELQESQKWEKRLRVRFKEQRKDYEKQLAELRKVKDAALEQLQGGTEGVSVPVNWAIHTISRRGDKGIWAKIIYDESASSQEVEEYQWHWRIAGPPLPGLILQRRLDSGNASTFEKALKQANIAFAKYDKKPRKGSNK